jgi:hypothetical protein
VEGGIGSGTLVRRGKTPNVHAALLPASRVAPAMTRGSVLAGGKDRSARSAEMAPDLRTGRSCRDGRSVPTGLRDLSVLKNRNSLNRTVSQRGSRGPNDARDLLSLSNLNVPSNPSASNVGIGQSGKRDQLSPNGRSV